MAGYGTNEGFAAWLADNGYAMPDSAPAPGVLRQRASVYVDGLYYDRFPGRPAGGAAQDRQWPRAVAVDRYGHALDDVTVPQRVIDASYQAAWIEAQNPGTLATTYTPGQNKVLTEVKGIKWEVVGNANADRAMVPVSTAVEALLAPILTPANIPAVLVV
ncbi:DnaT-like ssDNA-binding protein [Pararhizobium mangrovi]|uniref:Putative DnaT-like domain-containing protein n=1 Tax=Pararhizobium mangrovi TaxID=2590452 RepID=A0A506U0B4_9HYPH|nr:DnaT-like ssDNA-binding protein [Pararhizobium mangrovi]TPW26029.1 hypothetical protein FJU11_16580 [Pararhizobium mangrovi]